MFKSMTAFGRDRRSVGGKDITVEIKSVNNRYFDCSVKLPHAFSPLEQRIRKKAEKNLALAMRSLAIIDRMVQEGI